MPHLRGHLLDRIGELALGELLVGEIEDHENDGSGSQCLHEGSPNQVASSEAPTRVGIGTLPAVICGEALKAWARPKNGSRYFSPNFSPSSLPVDVLMKWSLVQAGHLTGVWVASSSAGVSASQCCTFIPVREHLNRMGLAMADNMAGPQAAGNYG